VQVAQAEKPRVQVEPAGAAGAETTEAEPDKPGEPRRSAADGEPPA